MALAIFDLDNTLLGGDSDHQWGEFLCDREIVDPQAYREKNNWFYGEYEKGRLDMKAWMEFALQPLVGQEQAVLQAWHQDFMTHYIAPIMLPQAAAVLKKHREQGDFLLIITATNRFITAPIAARLGVDALIASEAEIVDQAYTGRSAGIPCYQEGKVLRLEAWLSECGRSMENSYFYSDSHNDLPLLEQVDNPVAVNPDATLEKYAMQRGWPVISLRD